LIGGEDFEASIAQGGQAQGRVMGGLPNGWMVNVFLGERSLKTKEEKEYEKKELIPMCEGMLFMKERCANKEHGRKCV
jgi:hypothetical protein